LWHSGTTPDTVAPYAKRKKTTIKPWQHIIKIKKLNPESCPAKYNDAAKTLNATLSYPDITKRNTVVRVPERTLLPGLLQMALIPNMLSNIG